MKRRREGKAGLDAHERLSSMFEAYRALHSCLGEVVTQIPWWRSVPRPSPEPRTGAVVPLNSLQVKENIVPGMVLIAHPLLDNKIWKSTVMLILEHDVGSVAVFLGRVSARTPTPALYGGPVIGDILIWSKKDLFVGKEFAPGLYWGYLKKENRVKLANVNKEDYCLFLGHAEWRTGQLQSELGEGSWFVAKVSEDYFFKSEDAANPIVDPLKDLVNPDSNTEQHELIGTDKDTQQHKTASNQLPEAQTDIL